MPTPTDYAKCCIYKLVCKDLAITDVYVGHTTNFSQRKAEHHRNSKTETRKEHSYRVYEKIRDTGGFQNWSMLIIEQPGFENKHAATARERHWIETLGATLNVCIPKRTNVEYLAYLSAMMISAQPENSL
jgi:hypothetical protein